jgi:hypothetical protein
VLTVTVPKTEADRPRRIQVSRQEWRQLGRQPGYSRVGYADAIQHGQQVTVITFWSASPATARTGR